MAWLQQSTFLEAEKIHIGILASPGHHRVILQRQESNSRSAVWSTGL